MTDAPGRPEPSPLRIGAALGGVVLAAVVVFGLGVMVGKRVAESVPPTAPPPAALPTETVPPVPAVIPPEKLTFYDRLSGVAPPPLLPLPEGQSSAPAAKEPAPPPAEPPAPAAAKEAPARPPAKAPAPPAASADAGTQVRKLAGKGNFAVQVVAVNDKAAAQEALARIKGQGFEAVTVMASVKGKVWYRIRVGTFPSRQAAAKAAGIFRSAYGYDAIVVHD